MIGQEWTRDIVGDTDLDELEPPDFAACMRRARELSRASGLTHDELAERVRSRFATGAAQFVEVLKGKRQPRGWHRLMRAIAEVLADEDGRPLPLETKATAYLRRIYGVAGAPRWGVMDLGAWVADGESWVDLTRRLIAIDWESIPGLSAAAEGTLEQWTELHAQLHDCGRLLVADDGSIAGYWLYAPLQPEAFARAANGRLCDSELRLEDVVLPGPRGTLDVYLVVTTLLPAWRNTLTRHRLVDSLLDHFAELAELGLYIDRLCFCAYSLESEALARSLGMRQGPAHVSDRLLEPDGRTRPAHVYAIDGRDVATSDRIARHWPHLAERYARWWDDGG